MADIALALGRDLGQVGRMDVWELGILSERRKENEERQIGAMAAAIARFWTGGTKWVPEHFMTPPDGEAGRTEEELFVAMAAYRGDIETEKEHGQDDE